MTEADTYAALTEIFGDVFNRPLDLRPEMTAADVPGWDSFKQVEIIMACEVRFGFSFTTREMDGLQRVGDLVRLIERRTT